MTRASCVVNAGAPVVLAKVNPGNGTRWWRAVVRFEPLEGFAGSAQVIESIGRVAAEGSEYGSGLVRVFDLETSESPELPARAWLAVVRGELCVVAGTSGSAQESIALRCRLETFGVLPADFAEDEHKPITTLH